MHITVVSDFSSRPVQACASLDQVAVRQKLGSNGPKMPLGRTKNMPLTSVDEVIYDASAGTTEQNPPRGGKISGETRVPRL
jgi:hypothetical protein